MSRRAALLAVTLLIALSACSTVPMTSATVQIPQSPSRPAEFVGIEPLPPEPGATPEEIVRSFIDAAASTRPGHPVAREHLAPDAARSWSDEAGVIVIGQDYATVTTETGAVVVTANPVGSVDERGVFTVGDQTTLTRQFSLEQIDEQWRITDPPDGLIILEPDFQRLYEEAAAYFLDPTDQRLVPDPRYVVAGEALPTAMVERLLAGPSGPLGSGAVRNPLTGARLRSAVTLDGQAAVVDLSGLPPEPSPLLSEVSAQLVWTLTQLRNVSVWSVEVRVDGEPVDIEGVPREQTVGDWPAFDPDAVPSGAVGHYLSGGALRSVTGEQVPGPAGSGAYGLTDAAVSVDAAAEQSFLVGVRPEGGGETLLAGPYAGDLAVVLSGASRLSSPTVAATRSEAWVVRDGTSVVRVQAGGPPQPVTAPTLPGLGMTEVLRLSPDGVRAALVIEGPGGRSLYVGTVVRAEDGSVALRDLRAIAPELSRVADVAWRDSGSLLVLAGSAGEAGNVPYSVGVDGWGLTRVPTAGLPSPPQSIAAVPDRQPLVDAGGTIWRLSGGTWVTLQRGEEPLPGTAPFYPL